MLASARGAYSVKYGLDAGLFKLMKQRADLYSYIN